MISEKQLCDLIGSLESHMLRQWVEAGLVQASRDEPLQFDDADVARVHLICELHYELAIDEETLPLIVSLMDQLYSLRRSSRALSEAIADESEEVRGRIRKRVLEKMRV